MILHQLEKYTGQLLAIDRFKDYAPNGLQVEGKPEIFKLACAVSASEAAIDAAIACGADALLVHHGYFWRGEDARVVGNKRRRLAKLLANDMSLLAYHLPLDAHPELGNNAQLGARLGLSIEGRFGEQDLGCYGVADAALSVEAFCERVATQLARKPLHIGRAGQQLGRVAWCSGGAQSYLDAAIAAGCQTFLTGEVSEQHYHLALESGVTFIAAGHHATERYGVQALAAHLAKEFGLQWQYLELENPV